MVTDEIKKWVQEWVAGFLSTRVFGRVNHQQVSRGAASRGQPIILNPSGKIDESFIGALPADSIADEIEGATAKTTPVDADRFPLVDSAASFVLKYVTWANILGTIRATAHTWTGLNVFQNATYPPLRAIRDTAETIQIRSAASTMHRTSGNMADGFGAAISFETNDSGVSGTNIIGQISVVRDGADNSGKIQIQPYSAGNVVLAVEVTKEGRVGIGSTTPTDVVTIVQAQTTGSSLSVTRNLTATSTDSPVASIVQDHATDDQDALQVKQDGTGDILELNDGGTVVLRVPDGGRLEVLSGAIKAAAAVGSNAIVSLTDADMVNPFTGAGFAPAADADEIGRVASASNTVGGMAVQAFSEADATATALYLQGHMGHTAPTAPAVRIDGYKYNGSGARVALAAGELVAQFTNAGTPVITVQGNGSTGIGVTPPTGRLHADQESTTAAIPVLVLDQADLSEEFIEFDSTVGAGNALDTAALGTYYGKARVSVNGTFKFIALYNV